MAVALRCLALALIWVTLGAAVAPASGENETYLAHIGATMNIPKPWLPMDVEPLQLPHHRILAQFTRSFDDPGAEMLFIMTEDVDGRSVRQMLSESLKGLLDRKPLRDERFSACSGTQDGWIVDAPDTPNSKLHVVLAVNGNRAATAVYSALGYASSDAAAIAALGTLCVTTPR